MKPQLLTIAVASVVSSLVTVTAVELLRGDRQESRPGAARPVAPATTAPATKARGETLAAPPSKPGPDWATRLDELERRLAELEAGTGRRTEVPDGTEPLPEARDEMRLLVLDWVAEEREMRRQTADRKREEEARTQREFDARFRAFMLARDHDLSEWEQEKLVSVFLAVQERSDEVDATIDPLTDDPEEVEARWEEFDAWAEQYEKDAMGPELYRKIEQAYSGSDEE